MATMYKRRARKAAAVGRITASYGNYNSPLLLEKKHIALNFGDYIIRIPFGEAEELIAQIRHYLTEYKEEK